MPIKTVVNQSTHMHCSHLILMYIKCLSVRNQCHQASYVSHQILIATQKLEVAIPATWANFSQTLVKGYSPKLGQYNPTAWLCPVSLGGLLNSVEEEKVSFRIWSLIKEECDSCKWLYLSKDLFLNYRSSMASGTDESFLFSVILTESFRHLLGTLELPLTCSSCLTCMCHCH